MWYGAILYVRNIRGTACDVRYNMMVLAEPAVSCYFEQICALSWIGNENSAKKISSVRCDIFRECQRC